MNNCEALPVMGVQELTKEVTIFNLVEQLPYTQYLQVMELLDSLSSMEYSDAFLVKAENVDEWLNAVLGITTDELQ